jgi:hypothetical protein
VQDVAGSPGELWDEEDSSRVALRNEVETLQGQVDRLIAEVRLGSALKEPHSIDDAQRTYNHEKSSVSRRLSSLLSRQQLQARRVPHQEVWARVVQRYVDFLRPFH